MEVDIERQTVSSLGTDEAPSLDEMEGERYGPLKPQFRSRVLSGSVSRKISLGSVRLYCKGHPEAGGFPVKQLSAPRLWSSAGW